MPPQLALILTLAFILWLMVRDMKARDSVSPALWIPLLWLLIIGSRPLSAWFGLQITGDSQLDGSPFDRLCFLVLIISGLLVLVRRHVRWSNLIAKNKWLFIFFVYLGFSVLWSDYPLVAFKRWIKDVGNIVMVLVILNESDPVEAVKTVFLRCAFVLVPLSITLIKYFPNLGRYYSPWSGAVEYGGVTTNKNMLGATLIIYGLALLWETLELHDDPSRVRKRFAMSSLLLLLGMIAWLFLKAQSQTSLVCTLLGAGILLAMRLSSIRSRASRMGLYIFVLALVFLLLNSVFDITGIFVHSLGRNMTLTDRTEIWRRVLNIPINTLIGTGYYSFWLDPQRVDKVSEGFFYHLNEAHNGYIETYLNSGLVGVFLLAALLLSSFRAIKNNIIKWNGGYDVARLALLTVGMFYNCTEAAFDRLGVVWFAVLLAIVGHLNPPAAQQEGNQNQPLENNNTRVFAPLSEPAEV
jgi:O-antigen ligase